MFLPTSRVLYFTGRVNMTLLNCFGSPCQILHSLDKKKHALSTHSPPSEGSGITRKFITISIHYSGFVYHVIHKHSPKTDSRMDAFKLLKPLVILYSVYISASSVPHCAKKHDCLFLQNIYILKGFSKTSPGISFLEIQSFYSFNTELQ